jgi:hypothetical protein
VYFPCPVSKRRSSNRPFMARGEYQNSRGIPEVENPWRLC